ncbi:hypothetical protein [Sulfurimonas sp. HSL-1716]|uniref:hypothetical protein n=1 Tax=Hydrocurvibacter sulfurireducens TaxID=3131937 RepID=UPI0031F97DE9
MSKITLKSGSTPAKLHLHFMAGKSLTFDEAYEMKIRHLTQRIADLHKKFIDAGAPSPLMVFDEPNDRGGTHSRYFYRHTNCPYENKTGARAY